MKIKIDTMSSERVNGIFFSIMMKGQKLVKR